MVLTRFERDFGSVLFDMDKQKQLYTQFIFPISKWVSVEKIDWLQITQEKLLENHIVDKLRSLLSINEADVKQNQKLSTQFNDICVSPFPMDKKRWSVDIVVRMSNIVVLLEIKYINAMKIIDINQEIENVRVTSFFTCRKGIEKVKEFCKHIKEHEKIPPNFKENQHIGDQSELDIVNKLNQFSVEDMVKCFTNNHSNNTDEYRCEYETSVKAVKESAMYQVMQYKELLTGSNVFVGTIVGVVDRFLFTSEMLDDTSNK